MPNARCRPGAKLGGSALKAGARVLSMSMDLSMTID